MTTTLHWRDFGAGRPFHAAFVPIEQRQQLSEHSHADFHELVYVVDGHGVHRVGGTVQPLEAGDLALVRAHDRHDFAATDPDGMSVVNVAFASERWRAFVEYAGIAAAPGWERAELPVIAHDVDTAVADAMISCPATMRDPVGWLDLIRLWTTVIPALESALAAPDDRPPWLVAACSAMYAEENLREGLPRLRALASVSAGHLARSMSDFASCSPVEFVNRVRLDHAATLLATTTDPIGVVAERCGFAGHAYFCNRFHERFGLAPGKYRDQARRAVVP